MSYCLTAGVALEEVATPNCKRRSLVKIRATLGFPDYLMTHGGYQLKPLPVSPGMEGAGIAALGGDAAGRSAIKWCAAAWHICRL